MGAQTHSRWREWRFPAALIVLSLVPAAAGTARLAQLAMGSPEAPEDVRFFTAPFPVILHILAVVPYSILGALQFVPSLRRSHRQWHRVTGALLAMCGLVAALTGLWMAHFYEWPASDGHGLYVMRMIVGIAMVMAIVMGVDAIRRRHFTAHGEWMTLAYAIGMGAGTQALTHMPWFILVKSWPDEFSRTFMMGIAWIINVVIAAWIIRPGARRLPARTPAATGAPGRRRAADAIAATP